MVGGIEHKGNLSFLHRFVGDQDGAGSVGGGRKVHLKAFRGANNAQFNGVV